MGKIVECKIKDWDDFELKLKDLEAEHIGRKDKLGLSDFLFRGHKESQWELETTLERYVSDYMSLEDYYIRILRAKPQVESFTGQRWNIPLLGKYQN